MGLPEGTFRGLARVVSPLSFWMAAGWAAYPTAIQRISADMGEAMDIAEVRLFSAIMTVCCLGAGIALAVYGFTGRDARDEDLRALAKKSLLCPYCGATMASDNGRCGKCGKEIPRVR